jgi:predicted lipoprotein with Yx(FWY)xxD motif
MTKRWLLIGATLLIALLSFAFVACDDDEDDGDGNGDAATPTESIDEPTEPAGETPGGETPGAGETPGGQGAFSTVVVTDHATLGPILTTFDGYTVYTFDNDTENTSTCVDQCASLWPPLPTAGEPSAGEGVPGSVATITRSDGSVQVTYDGMPLYLYSADASPGDANGDGVGGTWHVVSIP